MSFSPLMPPEALRERLEDVLILDVRPRDAHEAGHLPGALPVDMEADLSTARAPDHDPALGGRHPLPDPQDWAARLGAWGIHPDTPVVVHDEVQGASGAARAWWMLRAAGHRPVAVLDGGLQAALAAGIPLVECAAKPKPRPPYPFVEWLLPLADLEDVANIRQLPDWALLDVRAPERYRGEVEPLDPVAGRIPGARNLYYGRNLDASGRFRAPGELRDMYLGFLGKVPRHRTVVHCGSGITACHTLLALEVAGLPGAALYAGSFSEWCRSGQPVARG